MVPAPMVGRRSRSAMSMYLFYSRQLLRVYQRAEIEFPVGGTHPQGGEARGAIGGEIVVDRIFDQHTGSGGTSLTAVLDDCIYHGRRCGIETGIGEEQLRALTAELQRHRNAVDGGGRCISVPTSGEPVKLI
jgi:hypothetical protein